jgi:glycosyltransferase involved in cell wall biosynthesis
MANDEAADSLVTLSVVIPCYNEERTLAACVQKVLEIHDTFLTVEVIIVDDCSTDASLIVADRLRCEDPRIHVVHHARNRGKGAALRTGIAEATGRFIAVQDADLEYSPSDLKRLIVPLLEDDADVVFGSRFLSSGAHRVLYFWHSLGNKFLTFLSNMLTDLNLTDMETGYKVFRRDVIQSIDIQENRFGFEPEIVAKVAQRRLRVYEMGISYRGRTYAEGKKIGLKDAWRALYCVLKYNLHKAPWPVQFGFYLFIGGVSAIINLLIFLLLLRSQLRVELAAPAAFLTAAAVNYCLSVAILFRHRARWSSAGELALFFVLVSAIGAIDLFFTRTLLIHGLQPWLAKSTATGFGLILNFWARRFVVFREAPSPQWKDQQSESQQTGAAYRVGR